MSVLKVNGGVSLKGEVSIAGAKNAVTKMIVASLISDKKCTLRNVPNIGDVKITLDLCRELGSEISWDQKDKVIQIQTKELKTTYIPQRFSGANRIPILMIGALLGRTPDEIIVPTMGGCKIGERPVDFHISSLEALGATIEYRNMKTEGAYLAHAHEGLQGTRITLPYPSVGATENAILASVRAKGRTCICNAAIEPEVIDLILFLQKMGVYISVSGDRQITVQETKEFREPDHTVMPDRVEAASFAMASICTGGHVLLKEVRHEHMMPFLNYLRETGGDFNVTKKGIECFASSPLKGGLHIETGVYPGFLTDWQQPFVILLTQAKGTSIIHETVYENRFGYTSTLKKMGANLNLFPHCLGGSQCRYATSNHMHSLVINGPTPLVGNTIEIPDLRAGFAYVLAGLIAEGPSIIKGLPYLTRGYENLVEKLSKLGAAITIAPEQQTKEIASKKEPIQAPSLPSSGKTKKSKSSL